MKFGRNLARNQVPEWGDWYIQYKALKKQIKSTVEAQKAGKEDDFAEFFFALDRNLENVDGFYNKRLAEFTRRFGLLESRYSLHPPHFDPDEASELLNALLELRSSLRKLEWYAEVNRRGFTKILKKLDKKTELCAQKIYLDTKVSVKPFATAEDAGQLKAEVNAWISKIGEDNTEMDPQTRNIERVPSPGRSFWELPPSTIDTIDNFLRSDNEDELKSLLSLPEVVGKITHKFELALLQRAISNKAPQCIKHLLGKIDDLHEEDDINERNILHRLVILIGKTGQQSFAPLRTSLSGLATNGGLGLKVPKDSKKIFVTQARGPVQPQSSVAGEIDELDPLANAGTGDLIKVLKHILESLRPIHYSSLTAKDTYGRMPLHYAAFYGVPLVCKILLQFMSADGVLPEDRQPDSLFWQDLDGLAPLHLAISNEHVKTTEALLQTGLSKNGECNLLRPAMAYSLAINADAVKTLKMMVEFGVPVNAQYENGESALHMAARAGKANCLEIILHGSQTQRPDVELAESTYGWTPLFVAAVEGKDEVVDMLLATGKVDVDRYDSSGWTATEHAALRGHLNIARKLRERTTLTPGYSKASSNTSSGAQSPWLASSPGSDTQNNGSYFPGQGNGNSNGIQHLKSFGHRYLKDDTLVLITLGTTDTRKDLPAVILDQVPLSHAHSTLLDSALSVAVSVQNARGEKTIIDLPIQDNLATENPICFETSDISKVKLIFDIIPTYSGSPDKIIGRAVALLDTVKPYISKHRVSLHGGVQVPILAVSNLDVIGCINFEFSVVTPFVHEGLCINREVTYWKELTGPKVIGHRGLGKNAPSRKSLQLGENTIQSFISAANLGASYVEFDVQLTKDLVPVIYHDFLVGETGIDAPVHALTLEQFLSMNDNHPRQKGALRAIDEAIKAEGRITAEEPNRGIRRSRSMSLHDSDGDLRLQERMKYTRNYKMKGGFKGNTRGTSIQGPFTTLEEVFKTLPPEIGFNIELKYPMLQETEAEDMETLGIEMNSWVDAVLKVVYDNLVKQKRDIIFSSFNPDVCLLLSFKQPSIPILFLTEGGTEKMADIRASCLQEAIRFASRWNLLGIVSAAEPFILCPRLVKVVKESGLVCVTYGTMNNVTANVQLQVEQGVDAVIVDSVLEIRKGLTAAGVV